MAMFIGNSEASFYVGMKVPPIKGDDLLEVQADGHELSKCEYILNRKVNGRVHIFSGEDAREIILNWNNYNKCY